MIEKLLAATSRNGWIFFLRIFGVALLIVGVVTAVLGMKLAGLAPMLWVLLGFASFLGVVCNSLFRIVLHLERKAHD
jgi:hypothetical protein